MGIAALLGKIGVLHRPMLVVYNARPIIKYTVILSYIKDKNLDVFSLSLYKIFYKISPLDFLFT